MSHAILACNALALGHSSWDARVKPGHDAEYVAAPFSEVVVSVELVVQADPEDVEAIVEVGDAVNAGKNRIDHILPPASI